MVRTAYRHDVRDRDEQRVRANAWVMLALLCTVQWTDVLGTTIMIVALPSIQGDLGLSGASVELAAGIYALTFGGSIIVTGRLSDIFGARRLLLSGLAMFSLASLLCGVAVSPAMLIVARALQGLGAALATPAALTMVTDLFPDGPLRHRALGVWTAAAAGGGAAGFALGGAITDVLGWRWIFLLNVPLGLLALAILPRLIGDRWASGVRTGLNVVGAVVLIAGLVALLAGVTGSKDHGLSSWPVVLILLAGVALLAAFVITERQSKSPLIPADLSRSPALAGSSAVAFALTATTSSAGVLIALYMQSVLGLSPASAGVMLAPSSLAVVFGSLAGARLTVRFGFRASMALGLAGVAAGMLANVGGVAMASLPLLVSGLVVSGAALGCASVASTAGGLSTIEENRKGVASGVLNATANIGTALGIALIPALGAVWIGASSLAGTDAPASTLTGGFQAAFVVAAVVAVAAIPLAWFSFPGRVGALATRRAP